VFKYRQTILIERIGAERCHEYAFEAFIECSDLVTSGYYYNTNLPPLITNTTAICNMDLSPTTTTTTSTPKSDHQYSQVDHVQL
jgi:hypothetical protein